MNNLIETLESKAFYYQPVFARRADHAAIILDLQLFASSAFRILSRCHRLQFLGLFAAQFGNISRLPQFFQTIKGRFDHVVRISTAQ
jgi:hypothetical protein